MDPGFPGAGVRMRWGGLRLTYLRNFFSGGDFRSQPEHTTSPPLIAAAGRCLPALSAGRAGPWRAGGGGWVGEGRMDGWVGGGREGGKKGGRDVEGWLGGTASASPRRRSAASGEAGNWLLPGSPRLRPPGAPPALLKTQTPRGEGLAGPTPPPRGCRSSLAPPRSYSAYGETLCVLQQVISNSATFP